MVNALFIEGGALDSHDVLTQRLVLDDWENLPRILPKPSGPKGWKGKRHFSRTLERWIVIYVDGKQPSPRISGT